MASSQSSFHNHFCTSRLQILLHGTTSNKLTFRKEKRLPYIPRKVNFEIGHLKMQGAVLIKAVASLEPNTLAQSEGHMNDLTSLLVPDSSSQVSQYPSKDSAEKLRRMRISKANKGNVAWNKGMKHSPEVRQRISERTKLAMQSPKVKEKLVSHGYAMSEETRRKIGVGVRVGWERRRAKMIYRKSCHFKWQTMIAEASRKGYAGQEELQWNSYEVLSKKLQQEWLESIEWRRSNPNPNEGSKRSPKSPEQRKKISEAIAAKWADPVYRERVRVGMSKLYSTPTTAERKPKRRPRAQESCFLKWQNLIAEAARKGYACQEELQWNFYEDFRERRNAKLMAQESCLLKWLNLIAEAARKGYTGQEELQLNSYVVLSKQLKQEWLDIKSIEQSRSKPKPKRWEPQYSPGHRKKISEAIAAKWADPDYRERIYQAPAARSRRAGSKP